MKTFLLVLFIVILFQNCNYSQATLTHLKNFNNFKQIDNNPKLTFHRSDTNQVFLNDIDKFFLYEEGRKTKTSAVALSLILPGLGHVYTRNYLTGLAFFVGELGAMTLAITEGIDHGNLKTGFWIGSIISFVGRVWEIIDACKKVNQFNKTLYQRVFNKPKPELTKTLVPLQNNKLVSYSFNF